VKSRRVTYVVYSLEWPTGSYVGMTGDLGARLAKHRSHFGTGKHHCAAAQELFNRFGFPKATVLAFTASRYEAAKLEKKHTRTRGAVNTDGKRHFDLLARQRAFFGGTHAKA